MGKKKREKDYRRHRLLSISSEDSDESLDRGPSPMTRVHPRYCNPRTKNQSLFMDALKSENSQIIVCSGSAGTGKTLISCQESIRSFLNKTVDRIIITRPAVCADEDIGFLPGDLDEKMRPFTQPLFDTFEKIIPRTYCDYMIHKNFIQIIPLAYMRGRTFENKFIIADEMQNASIEQMIMLLTRVGKGSKLVIVGDPSQCDRKIKQNGLADLVKRIADFGERLKWIQNIKLENRDIQREEAVKEVLDILYV